MNPRILFIAGAVLPMSAARLIALAAEEEERVRRVTSTTNIQKQWRIEELISCLEFGESVTVDGRVLDPSEYEIEGSRITLKPNLGKDVSVSYSIQAYLERIDQKPEPMLNGPRSRKRGKGKVQKW